MPLVCIEEGKAPRLVGVVTEEGKAMIFAPLWWILEGMAMICLATICTSQVIHMKAKLEMNESLHYQFLICCVHKTMYTITIQTQEGPVLVLVFLSARKYGASGQTSGLIYFCHT